MAVRPLTPDHSSRTLAHRRPDRIASMAPSDFKEEHELNDLAPPDFVDPVIEAYKKDVDRSLLRENLKLSVDERFQKFESFSRFARELYEAGLRAHSTRRPD